MCQAWVCKYTCYNCAKLFSGQTKEKIKILKHGEVLNIRYPAKFVNISTHLTSSYTMCVWCAKCPMCLLSRETATVTTSKTNTGHKVIVGNTPGRPNVMVHKKLDTGCPPSSVRSLSTNHRLSTIHTMSNAPYSKPLCPKCVHSSMSKYFPLSIQFPSFIALCKKSRTGPYLTKMGNK